MVGYTLPDLDGLTTLRRLRERGMACPAIVLAGNPTARCRADAKKAGAPVVEKPIVGDELTTVLRRLLGKWLAAQGWAARRQRQITS